MFLRCFMKLRESISTKNNYCFQVLFIFKQNPSPAFYATWRQQKKRRLLKKQRQGDKKNKTATKTAVEGGKKNSMLNHADISSGSKRARSALLATDDMSSIASKP